MKSLSYLWKMVIHPRRTTDELFQEKNPLPALWIILGFGLIFAVMMLISHLQGGYPPPPADLKTWIEAWGSFTMLPFINVPAESYRLVQAIFMIPLMFVIWMLMAGSARLLSISFGSKTSFDQFLNLLVFSFFPWWILASVMDGLMSGVFGGFVLSALRMEHGVLAKNLITNFYPVMYSVLFGLGGVYNGLATYRAGGLKWWQAALIGFITFFWPLFFATILLR